MKKLKFISLVLVLAMILPSVPVLAAERSRASPADNFTDCDTNAWYYPAIEYTVEHELMEGVGDGLMEPERTITRAEFVTMICRLLGTYTMADASQFEDLSVDAWYYDFMRMGLQLGIIKGISRTRVDAGGSLTREQAVVILARVLALPAGDASMLNKYTDKEDISDWAVDAASAMTAAGQLKGYPDGALRPKQVISRAETAHLLLMCFPMLLHEGNIRDASYKQNLVFREQPLNMENVQANGAVLFAPSMGDGTAVLKGCQIKRLVCWGTKDVYIYPDCSIEEIVLSRTDGPCTIHWLGTGGSTPPKITVTDNSHPGSNVVDQDDNSLLPPPENDPEKNPEKEPEKEPEKPTNSRPKVYFVPQINGSGSSYAKVIGSDGLIQPMESPVWEGHVFGGWYTEPECETRFSFTQPVTNGMRLYGKWYTDAEWAEIERLNGLTSAGTIRIDCETDFLATIGTNKLPCRIHSNESNQPPLRVELVREDTGEVVAYIDRLAPGETATEMTVSAMPEYGNYAARLVFRDGSGQRQTELQATLYVAYLWNRGE